jgi:hypothetical protein
VLIDQILSVNLSCSGITFAGSGGGNVSLEAIFKQYFTNSGAESSFGTTGINLTVSNSQLTSELAEAVSSADSLSALDERAKQIFDAQTKTRLEKEAELDKALSSRQFYTADAGKVSPSFDAKDTTAGLVLLAYSDISSNVQTAKLLFDLLLNAASPSSHSSTTTEEAISNQAAIPLDFLAVLPTSITNVEALTGSPVFFGENMLPVSSEDQSPFRFCP